MTALETKAAPRARAGIERRRDDAGDDGGEPRTVRFWVCHHCGRHLARVVGRVFETPGGVRGNLPARITCPRCKTHNVRL